MINEENEKIIQNLLSHDIKYPLIIKGFNDREYKVNKVYMSSNKVMIQVMFKNNIFTESLCDYSYIFQKNLIDKLKQFENNIWND